jgi:murein DD-endopeptidase MepM/ murein hydrolase activator NlpD/predicted alpha/beta hydrolase family esterase
MGRCDATSGRRRTPARSRPGLLLVLVAVLLVAAPPPAASAVDAAGPVGRTYRLPVAAPSDDLRRVVVAPFDPPATPFGRGHRGVDLRVAPGGRVLASGAGTVAFAGAVGGERWVSVDHPDGVRTSYGALGTVLVRAGDRVARGQAIGTAQAAHGVAGILHWGARRGGVYLDPLGLLPPARLVPSLLGGPDSAPVPRDDLPSYAPWDDRRILGVVRGSPVATGPGWSLPPNPNHVVAIAGLGSATGDPPLDVTHLGYAPASVTELSYAGRERGTRQQARYGPPDTWRGVAAASARLELELRAHARERPGQAVDLVGHSMGGVVALHYLLTRHDPTDPALPPIAHVVTIASPLEGSDIARVLVDAQRDPAGRAVVAAIGGLVAEHDPAAPAVRDLAVGSALLDDLADAWAEARADVWAGPLGTGTRLLTIAGQVDLVVPAHRAGLPDADHRMLPGGHDRVRHTEAVRQVVRAFLADEPVPGAGGGLAHWLSHPVSLTEQVLGRLVTDLL